MHRSIVSVSALLALSTLAASALANPRDSHTFTNQDSEVGTFGPGGITPTFTVAAQYTVKHIVISGQLTRLAASTCANEAVIRVFDPNGAMVAAISPFQQCANSPTFTVSNYVYTLPQPHTGTSGTWSVAFNETFDDAGIDARWDNITITLDDGAPTWILQSDVGAVRAPGFSLANQTIGANAIRWYKIDLPVPAANLGFFGTTFLDIDTEGSAHVDMELGLYDVNGKLIATDDDSGSGNQARLTFGADPARPAIGNGSSYNNEHGSLEAGTYYLAVGAFNTEFGPTSWNAVSTYGAQASFSLNVRTDIDFSPFCRGDHNKSNGASLQDVFDFLNDWFAGCP